MVAAVATVMTPEAGDAAITDTKPITLTPPPSSKVNKIEDMSSSDLSDLDDEDDVGEIVPDHYYEGGKVPVFKPVSDSLCAGR